MQVMQAISGYDLIEMLHEGVNTQLFRAQSQSGHQSVILKILKAEYPTLEQIIRLKYEYQITATQNSEHIVKAYRLETYQKRLILVLEDFGGQSLKHWLAVKRERDQLRQGLPLDTFLKIAVQLAKAVVALHEQNIIHKDINPSNVLLNPQTGQVKLTDFSIASYLGKETPELTSPNQLEGTLAYLSPEQTGRMNRSVDYRSDFYSLGITFFELLTGQLPFQADDPLELVHCHIAKQPPLIQTLTPDVPFAVAAIVAKLMAKNAEDRYQSAGGLLADLEFCLEQIKTTGWISDMVPGARDHLAQLLIPQKLYGREAEVNALLAAFDRVANPLKPADLDNAKNEHRSENSQPDPPHSELMLVSGYSGIGKSSLVNEVHKPIVRQRGYFIAGKFDQFKRNIPYASLIQAFQSLIQQLLTERTEQLQRWREKLKAALGANGQVLVEVIPEVELIIGKQPAVPELRGVEAENRFNRVFQSFIQVFTQPDHPLVLFLDDLQWADSASLKLIQLLMTDPDSRYLLLIGAYRDNEVSPVHPLSKSLEAIQQAGATVSQIVLRPLELSHVYQIIADTLRATPHPQLINLAELLFNKTQGNPFFLIQLLKTLYQEKLLTFDFTQGCWQWDLNAIQFTGIADKSVVELIAGNIAKLPEVSQTVLKLAACVGDRFNIDILATVSVMGLLDVAQALQPALQAGLILPLNHHYKVPLLFTQDELNTFDFNHSCIGYRFLHDRVQQAAYSLIPDFQKQPTHLRVGQLLLQNTPPQELEANIFEIVNALNMASSLIDDPIEKTELARLNLIAGRKAKTAAAYEPAVSYLNQGIALLSDQCWYADYDLALSLYGTSAEAAFLSTDYALSEQLVNLIELNAANTLDKAKAYELKIQLYMAQLEMWRAIAAGLDALSMLGISIACPLGDYSDDLALPALSELDKIPEMTDPVKLAALRVLNTVTTTAYQTQPEIFRWIVLTQLQLCLEHGHCASAAFAYMSYAWYCGAIGAPDQGYQAGQIALKLLEQFDATELQCNLIQLFECFVRHQKEHLRETFTPLLEAIRVGLETGNLEYVSYSAMNYSNHIFFSGESLESLSQTQQHYIDLLLKLKQEFQIYYAQLWQQVTFNLQGKAADPCCLLGDSFDETLILPRLQLAQNHQSLFAFYCAKCILNYLFQNYSLAVESAELAQPYAGCGAGLMLSAVYCFYSSLSLLAYLEQAEQAEQIDVSRREQILASVSTKQQTMQRWARSAPMNYQHKYDLVAAELARIQGQSLAAMSFYDQAIEAAVENGYIQEAALANERAARFYLNLGKKRMAQACMTDAYYGYIKWGAIAKVHQLNEHCSDLILQTDTPTPAPDSTRSTTASTSSQKDVLDLTTVIRASEVIASELRLDNLLCRILHIILENAGAQKGCLILEKEGQLFVEAIDRDPDQSIVVLQSIPVESSPDIPVSLINYVARTQQPKLIADITQEALSQSDPYIQRQQPKSVLCAPIFYQGKFIGIIYLENNLATNAFTSERLELLKLLTAQAAIAIENARLYTREQEQSRQLRQKASDLEMALVQLQQTQAQLVQTEKISQLGQLVAGVAHEVNNPVSFISGNLSHATQYIEDLVCHLQLYQQHYPNPPLVIQEHIEEIDLEFLLDDLPRMIASMKLGTDRIREIMQSLRNYSRTDNTQKRTVDLHEGIETTLMILSHRLKVQSNRAKIQIVKKYGELPLIECYPGQLNQVFMNLLANAIDALEETNQDQKNSLIITIQTAIEQLNGAADRLVIRIADNGPGMTDEIRRQLFTPFFTTKPEGRGTGLGLSISHQIITETHNGTLQCHSRLGQGTEFVIELPVKTG